MLSFLPFTASFRLALPALAPALSRSFYNSRSVSSRFVSSRPVSARSFSSSQIPAHWSSVSTSSSSSSTTTTLGSTADPIPSPTPDEIDPGAVPGTSLRIVKYPHPALRHHNALVSDAELPEIATLAKEMFLVMYAANGVGLAAPQVGVNKRVMVYNPSGDEKDWLGETVFVNPTIVARSDAVEADTEGCLSFPDMNGEVVRNKWVKVVGVNLKGKAIKRKFDGYEARIFQHEYDHLDGVVYVDHLNEEDRGEVDGQLASLRGAFLEETGEEGMGEVKSVAEP